MIAKDSSEGFQELLSGISVKTLVFGQGTLMSKFMLKGGSDLPQHSHPNEQTGYLLAGRLRMTIGDRSFDLRPGDSWCIDKDVVHGAAVLEDSVAIEVFSPSREDYKKYLNADQAVV